MNISNFTKREKILLGIALVSLTAFLVAFVSKYFLADVRQLPFNYERETRQANYDFIISITFLLSFLFGFYSTMFLTKPQMFVLKGYKFDEFEKAKAGEQLQISLPIFLIILATIFILLLFNNNFIEHVYYSHNRFGEEYYLKALNNIKGQEQNLELAHRFLMSNARLDIMIGMNFVLFSFAISQLLASLLVWLKYR